MGGRTGESKLQSGVALMASRSSSSHLCSVLCSVSQHCERVFCVSFSHSSMGLGTTWISFCGGVSSDRLCICRYEGLMSKWRQKLGNTWEVYSEGVCGRGRLEARKAYTCYDDE